MKLLFVGDSHGNTGWFKRVMDHAVAVQADCIVQVGDFGIWPGNGGVKFRTKVAKYATESNIPVYFVDGNHEDFDRLFGSLSDNATVHTDNVLHGKGFREILPNLFYIPRGTVWEWGGIKFAGVGGAVSIDKEFRLLREKTSGVKIWWEQEQLTVDDLEYIKSYDGAVDVLVSHDTYMNPLGNGYYKNDEDSTAHRMQLLQVVKHLEPVVNIHGHYHHRHTTHDYRALVVGLGRDNDRLEWSTLLVDTDNGLDDFEKDIA